MNWIAVVDPPNPQSHLPSSLRAHHVSLCFNNIPLHLYATEIDFKNVKWADLAPDSEIYLELRLSAMLMLMQKVSFPDLHYEQVHSVHEPLFKK